MVHPQLLKLLRLPKRCIARTGADSGGQYAEVRPLSQPGAQLLPVRHQRTEVPPGRVAAVC